MRAAVAAWYQQSTAVFGGERREHPQAGKVHDRIRVRGGDVAGIPLVEGPVGVPSAALVARVVDGAGGEGYARVLAQHGPDQVHDPGVGQIMGEGLVIGDNAGKVPDSLRAACAPGSRRAATVSSTLRRMDSTSRGGTIPSSTHQPSIFSCRSNCSASINFFLPVDILGCSLLTICLILPPPAGSGGGCTIPRASGHQQGRSENPGTVSQRVLHYPGLEAIVEDVAPHFAHPGGVE